MKYFNNKTSAEVTGAKNNHAGASAHNEYRFTGSNYKGQHPPEVCEIMRKWLKETYPCYKFSVTRRDYNSITITLISADFEAFGENAKEKVYKQVNHHYIKTDDDLTDRAKEVLLNVYGHVNSYNFDDSDAMTDYFHCNFYLYINIGDAIHPYRVMLPKSGHKGKKPEVFKQPEGKTQKAIRQALGKAEFSACDFRKETRNVLCEKHFRDDGSIHYYPLSYSSRKTAGKRMCKLTDAGICCRLTGYNGGYIEFLGYTPETEEALKTEKQTAELAEKEWNRKQQKAA